MRFHNEYAYPVNTTGKPEAITRILAMGHLNGVFGLGRWGRRNHLNSNIAAGEALQLARELKHDWPE